jgi:REP element-mobilizing transposase RayT
MPYSYKQFRRRKLPHIQPPNATVFVTFRLAGSIPNALLVKWKSERKWLDNQLNKISKEKEDGAVGAASHEQRLLAFSREWFAKFEEVLHQAKHGPKWLRDPRLAKLIADSLHYRNGNVFDLFAYCIMVNHVHVLFRPFLTEKSLREKPTRNRLMYESDHPPLDVIMHSLKSFTANEANKILGRDGTFWEAESYDHFVRDDREFHRILRYILNNPVKARLVKDWRDWPWSWSRPVVRQAASLSTFAA